jgi:ketosteroid isomerase-like protein
MIRRVVFVCAVLLATTSAQDFPQSEEPASVIRNEYLHAYNLHDANSVLALYADDAVLLTEAGVFRGKSEISKWLQFAFDQGSVLEAITATREKSSTTIAYGTGQTKRLVGQQVHLGRYLIVLESAQGSGSSSSTVHSTLTDSALNSQPRLKRNPSPDMRARFITATFVGDKR